MLNQMVKVSLKNAEVIGKIIKVTGSNNDIIYVQSGDDTLKFFLGLDKIEVIDNDLTTEQIIEDWLDGNEMEYDLESCGGETIFIIKGFSYNVWVTVAEDIFYLNTMHLGRRSDGKEMEETEANHCERKTLKSVFSYISKWTNK